MIDTTTTQGFKAAAKNLKKSLTEYNTDISLSASQNLLSKALGYKNYNTAKVELDKNKSLLSQCFTRIKKLSEDVMLDYDSIENKITKRDIENIIGDIVEALNKDYRHYRDVNNCFLIFSNHQTLTKDNLDFLEIRIEKSFLGANRSMPLESKILKIKLDENGFPCIPNEDEFSSILEGMTPVKTYLSNVETATVIKMKEKSEFSSITTKIQVDKATVIKQVILEETKELSIIHNNIEYKGYDTNLKELRWLIKELGYSDTYVYNNIDFALSSIRNRAFKLPDNDKYTEMEVSSCLVKWLSEQLLSGSLDALAQLEELSLVGNGNYDINKDLSWSFFNTYENKIKNSIPIKITFLSDMAEVSRFGLTN